MKYSLGISNFLEETSSLSHSIVFLYFFALIAEEGFFISPCYSLDPQRSLATRGEDWASQGQPKGKALPPIPPSIRVFSILLFSSISLH